MDISIRSVAGQSSISGQAFQPGQRVWSLLYRTEEGQLERVDLMPDEVETFSPEGSIICKWSQLIKEKEESEAEARRAALQSTEEIFLSLYEDTATADAESGETPLLEETRDRLKFFLALQLERKRILRALGGRRFLHVPSKREFVVPDLELTPEMLAGFQEEISLMGTLS